MSNKNLTKMDLNAVVGFATVLTAINGMGKIAANPSDPAHSPQIGFFCFFVLLRFKMFIDDEDHNFRVDDPVGNTCAVVSWILFLFSASTISVDLHASISWFMWAIAVSTLWVVNSLFKAYMSGSNIRKYFVYLLFNVFYLLLLFLLDPEFPRLGFDWGELSGWAFIIPCLVVLMEWVLSNRH